MVDTPSFNLKTMKIYTTLENGNRCFYANKTIAKRNARKAYKDYMKGEYGGHSDEEVEVDNIPTDKKGLIDWLNKNAYYTGWTTD